MVNPSIGVEIVPSYYPFARARVDFVFVLLQFSSEWKKKKR